MKVIDSSAALADLDRRHGELLYELDSLNEMLEKALREASGKPSHSDEPVPTEKTADVTSFDRDGRSC